MQHEVAVQHIVGVENDVGVKIRMTAALHFAQKKVERIPLAAFCRVKALVHLRAVGAGGLGGLVGAVVRRDEYVQEPRRVALRGDAVQKISDDRLLVPRRNKNGDAVQRRVRPGFSARQPRHGYVQKLVHIAGKKQTHDHEVYHFYGLHCFFLLSPMRRAYHAPRRKSH